MLRKALPGLRRYLGGKLVRKEALADATGAGVHDPGTAVLGSRRGMAVAVRRGVSRMAREDQVHGVFYGLAHSGNKGPEQEQQETTCCQTLHSFKSR